MLEILAELMTGSQRPVVPVADIVAVFIERYGFEYERPITNRWIGSILRKRLNIGTCKSHGVYVVPMGDRSKIELLCARYGVSAIPPTAASGGNSSAIQESTAQPRDGAADSVGTYLPVYFPGTILKITPYPPKAPGLAGVA